MLSHHPDTFHNVYVRLIEASIVISELGHIPVISMDAAIWIAIQYGTIGSHNLICCERKKVLTKNCLTLPVSVIPSSSK